MACGLPYERLGPKSDAHACNSKHGKIVGPVSYRNDLFE